MPFKRPIFALVVSAVFLITLPVYAQDKVVLQLRWDHQFQFAGYYAAKWQGYYDQAGLDVDIRSAFEPDGKFHSVTREVAEGRADFGVAGADILKAQDKGDPLVIVNSIFQQSPVAFYSKSETNLHSPADLVGLRVGTRPGGVAGVELRAMLRAESIDPARVPQRPIQGNLGIHDIADGLLDVASGFTISAGWYARQLGLNLTSLRPQSYGVDFYGDALFTQRRWIEQDPELVQKFATASLKGWEYALTHPKEVADRISRELSRTIPIDDLVDFNNFQTKPVHRLIQFPIVQLGHTNPFRWKKMHDALKDAGLVKGQFNSDQAIFDLARLEKKNFERNVALAMSVVGVFIVVGILGWIVMLRRNLNARREIENALRQSEARFRAITETSPVPLIITRRSDGKILYANPKVGLAFGLAADEIIGRSITDFYWDSSGREERLVALEKDGYVRDNEVEMRKADGTPIWTMHSLQSIDWQGENAILGGFIDITERKRLEEQLRQAQKMEAVGQLTGGVAHDFNNLLATILGHAEMLEERLGGNDKSIRTIIRAAERGAELTQRLLAFSRRQSLDSKPIDLSALVGNVHQLLHRTLGETIDIEISMASSLWNAVADPGQLENALLNLTINARDAMPDGGKLIIEAANVSLSANDATSHIEVIPGEYVSLSVKDSGVGMPPEVMEHAIEPFYTTKDVGEGSGLGLSMVYGFAKQSGGDFMIESDVGQGTTVTLFLPRAKESVEQTTTDDMPSAPRGRGEAVLVIEDEPDVRAMTGAMLDNLGYRVLLAENAQAGLDILEAEPAIDLMLSDVVLPGGMSGPDMATQARAFSPEIKVLFMSGHAEQSIHLRTALPEGCDLLDKPFRKHELAQRVRAVLDR